MHCVKEKLCCLTREGLSETVQGSIFSAIHRFVLGKVLFWVYRRELQGSKPHGILVFNVALVVVYEFVFCAPFCLKVPASCCPVRQKFFNAKAILVVSNPPPIQLCNYWMPRP